MSTIAFLDTETLGLDPDKHAIWEVGLVLYDTAARKIESEHLWQIALTAETIAEGDPVGMEIGGFANRPWYLAPPPEPPSRLDDPWLYQLVEDLTKPSAPDPRAPFRIIT